MNVNRKLRGTERLIPFVITFLSISQAIRSLKVAYDTPGKKKWDWLHLHFLRKCVLLNYTPATKISESEIIEKGPGFLMVLVFGLHIPHYCLAMRNFVDVTYDYAIEAYYRSFLNHNTDNYVETGSEEYYKYLFYSILSDIPLAIQDGKTAIKKFDPSTATEFCERIRNIQLTKNLLFSPGGDSKLTLSRFYLSHVDKIKALDYDILLELCLLHYRLEKQKKTFFVNKAKKWIDDHSMKDDIIDPVFN